MGKIHIWGSPHQPTAEQMSELTALGTVLFLNEIDPVLFNKLSNLDLNTDLHQLAGELESNLFDMVYDQIPDGTSNEDMILFQPAGNPAFQAALGHRVMSNPKSRLGGLWYAYSERQSVDQPQADGSVRKVAVFVHKGWNKL